MMCATVFDIVAAIDLKKTTQRSTVISVVGHTYLLVRGDSLLLIVYSIFAVVSA